MSNAHNDRWLTRDESAAYLSTTTRSIDRMVEAKRLAPTYFGASKRFRQSQLDALVTTERNPVPPRTHLFGRALAVE
jgi:excisionase family DNA binding protein